MKDQNVMQLGVGVAILVLIFIGLFQMTAIGVGYREAIKMWAFSVALTAAVMAGVFLVVSSF